MALTVCRLTSGKDKGWQEESFPLYILRSGERQQSIMIFVLSFLKAKCFEHFMLSS